MPIFTPLYSEVHPSAAKAEFIFGIYGTTKVVPFQNAIASSYAGQDTSSYCAPPAPPDDALPED
jgi:hypothetical protein